MLSIAWNAIRLALIAIRRNATRSVLTVLGILIGIAAVVIVTSLAGGASRKVGGEIEGFAANAVFVSPQSVQASGAKSKAAGRLSEADVRAIQRDAPSVSLAAPFLSALGQVIYQEKNAQTSLIGTSIAYLAIRKYEIDRGEMWTDSDELLKTKVCVLGATVVTNLFGNEDPIGRIVRIGRSPFRVIGTLKARGSGPFGDDQDDRLLVPVGSFRSRIRPTAPGRVDQIMVSARSEGTTPRAMQQIKEILRQRHLIEPGKEDDFVVNSQSEFRQAQEAITGALSALLLAVAAVSLVVGGIGVMNIMLVSVAERTREIGIRMSIGARERDIMLQFLVEAVALTMVGGLLGTILGVSFTMLLGFVLDWPMMPSPDAILVAIGTSGGIGIVFGFFPARSAAKLDPIVALRSD